MKLDAIAIDKIIERASERLVGQRVPGLLHSEETLNQVHNVFLEIAPTCPSCKPESLECQICNLTVRGLSYFCLECGHGGHLKHMQSWF